MLNRLHLILGFIVAIDFISTGLIKRIKQKWFAVPYYWMNRYVGFATLSFVWRPIYLNFLDTRYTRRLFFLTVPYCIAVILMQSLDFNKNAFFPSFEIVQNESNSVLKQSYNGLFYNEDLEKKAYKTPFPLFTIPNKRVKGEFFEIFLRMFSSDDIIVKNQDSAVVPFRKAGLTLSDENSNLNEEDQLKNNDNIKSIKAIIQKSYELKLDDKIVDNDQLLCDFYIHPYNKTEGLLCYFKLDSLNTGRHYIGVKKKKASVNFRDSLVTVEYTVPFMYEGKN